jgi:hypothetical protein
MLSFQGIGATSGKGSGIAVIHKKTYVNSMKNTLQMKQRKYFLKLES